MPTYEYKCQKCGKVFDVFQKITDEPIKICPDCGGNVHRLISGGVGVIFKGNGFYVTDNKTGIHHDIKPKSKTAEPTNDSNDSKKSVKEKS